MENRTDAAEAPPDILVSKRAQEDVMNYLTTMHVQGVVEKSMREMAKATGISSATCLRALRKLEQQGRVRITKATNPADPMRVELQETQPETDGSPVIMTGSAADIPILQMRAIQLAESLETIANDLRQFQQESNRLVQAMGSQLADWDAFRRNITNTADFGDRIVIQVKKDANVPFIERLTNPEAHK